MISVLYGCDDTSPEQHDALQTLGPPAANTELANEPERARRAHLELQGTNKVKAEAHFEEVKDGVRIRAKLDGVPPGKYPVAVYETGDCNGISHDQATYFRFTKEQPGATDQGAPPILGEVEVEQDGDGNAYWQTARGSLRAEDDDSLLGKPIAFYHPGTDGRPGNLIACGTIESYQSR